jgi:hypothetical protein
MDPAILVSRMPPCQPFDLPDHGRLAKLVPGAVSHNRTSPIHDTAGPPLRHSELLTEIVGGSALLGGAHHFFCDFLEHLLVQEQLGNQLLESIDLELQFATPTICIDFLGITLLPPPIIRGLTDAVLATDVGDCLSSGQIAVGLLQQACNLIDGPSPLHGYLRKPPYSKTLISSGQIFREQAVRARSALCSRLDGLRRPLFAAH